jgi:hypothetical protein
MDEVETAPIKAAPHRGAKAYVLSRPQDGAQVIDTERSDPFIDYDRWCPATDRSR